MDQYYQAQVQMPYFRGAARQRGSGLAGPLLLGRLALPILQKYGLPVAKRLGKTVLETAIPEILDVITRKKKPKAAVKNIVRKTKNQAKSRAKAAVTKNVLPELVNIVAGQEKPTQALKKMVQDTIKDQLGGGVRKKARKVISRQKLGGNSRLNLLKNLQE